MECKKFEAAPLPYSHEALEPYIDTETLTVHHDVLYQRYVDNLNKALEKYPEYYCYSLEELLLGACYLPEEISTEVFRQAGGSFNHRFYFAGMKPAEKKGTELAKPKGKLKMAIDQEFGGFGEFQEKLKAEAMSVFGSGWAWLCAEASGKLKIVHTANQVTPFSLGLHPLICVDVWEHAYFLQYLAARNEYVDAWFHLANWDFAEANYESLLKCVS